MSSPGRPEKVNRFKGKSGAECEDFIQNIREAAWKEGKLDDTRWMAHFASLHYSGKALKWHSDLPRDVKQDWDKLEKALLEHWPPPDDESDNEKAETAVIPVPAAASLLSTRAGKSSDIGVVQFIPISGDQRSMYISKVISNGECQLTTEVAKALRLRWDRFGDSGYGVLERLDSGRTWLAIHWMDLKPSFTQGSTAYARLAVVGPDTWTPDTLSFPVGLPPREPFRIKVWKLSSEGQITPVWKDGVKEIQLGVFQISSYIYFAVDPDAYQKSNPKESRGRLVFQPIE